MESDIGSSKITVDLDPNKSSIDNEARNLFGNLFDTANVLEKKRKYHEEKNLKVKKALDQAKEIKPSELY